MNLEGIILPSHQLSDNDFNFFIQEIQFDLVCHRSDLNVSQLNDILFDQFTDCNSQNSQFCPDDNFYNHYSSTVNQCEYLYHMKLILLLKAIFSLVVTLTIVSQNISRSLKLNV